MYWSRLECCKKYEEDSKDRKSTRLNSSHLGISYAVFCLKKKKTRVKNNNYSKCDSVSPLQRTRRKCIYLVSAVWLCTIQRKHHCTIHVPHTYRPLGDHT